MPLPLLTHHIHIQHKDSLEKWKKKLLSKSRQKFVFFCQKNFSTRMDKKRTKNRLAGPVKQFVEIAPRTPSSHLKSSVFPRPESSLFFEISFVEKKIRLSIFFCQNEWLTLAQYHSTTSFAVRSTFPGFGQWKVSGACWNRKIAFVLPKWYYLSLFHGIVGFIKEDRLV